MKKPQDSSCFLNKTTRINEYVVQWLEIVEKSK